MQGPRGGEAASIETVIRVLKAYPNLFKIVVPKFIKMEIPGVWELPGEAWKHLEAKMAKSKPKRRQEEPQEASMAPR